MGSAGQLIQLRPHPGRRRLIFCVLVLAYSFGCAGTPEADPTSGTIWGYVRLSPKASQHNASSGYGDRRLAHVKRVDYSHPGFAVVFLSAEQAKTGPPVEFVIRDGPRGPRIDPDLASATTLSDIRIRNATQIDRLISVPAVGYFSRLKPGDSDRLDVIEEGELTLHLLGRNADGAGSKAKIWISTGPIVEIDATGRYTLRHLDRGQHELRAWHPRLPPTAPQTVDLERGDVRRIDIEIGVDAGRLDSKEIR